MAQGEDSPRASSSSSSDGAHTGLPFDHDSTRFDPSAMPQDYAVFYLNEAEAAGPPRTVTPYMRACAHYLEEEILAPGNEFARNVWEQLGAGIPFVGFMAMIFGIAFAFDPERVGMHRFGWCLFAAGALMFVVPIARMLIASRANRRGYAHVLKEGRLARATVGKVLVNDGITRELRFTDPVCRDGVLQYDRQWVILHEISVSIEGSTFDFVTYRPEIISVFQPGASVPVLWSPRWPKHFVPVRT